MLPVNIRAGGTKECSSSDFPWKIVRDLGHFKLKIITTLKTKETLLNTMNT